jgi:hypothetical protein
MPASKGEPELLELLLPDEPLELLLEEVGRPDELLLDEVG